MFRFFDPIARRKTIAATKLGRRGQVTLSPDIIRRAGLISGENLEVLVTGEAVLLLPKDRIPDDQAWFWTDEWQARESEADEAIARGDILGPFSTTTEALDALHNADV